MFIPRQPVSQLAGELGILGKVNRGSMGVRTCKAVAEGIFLIAIRDLVVELVLA